MKMNKKIFELLERNALRDPNKLAFADNWIRINWKEASRLVVNMSRELEKEFSQNKPRSETTPIVVKGDGSVMHVLLIFAIVLRRMVYVPHNRTLERNEKNQFNALPHITVARNEITLNNKSWTLDNFQTEEASETRILDTNEVAAAFYYTSGTTGSPKIIVNSDTNILRGAKFVSESLGLDETDVLAGTLLLDFDYGVNQIFCTLYLGATYIVAPFSSTSIHWMKMVKRYRPTVVPAMPFLIENYFSQGMDSIFDFVRLCTSSGAPLTKEHAGKILKLFPKAVIVPMYGLSEGFRATIMPPGEYENRPFSVGKPVGDTEIRIVKNGFEECDPMEIGEIIQSSGCTTWGYFGDLSSTSDKFVRDPDFPNRLWIKSGDLGYLDSEGYLYVKGRIESQIKLFGIRISIDEIEMRYKEIPGIFNAVVIPIKTNETESKFAVAIMTNLSPEDVAAAVLKLPREYRTKSVKIIPEILGNYNGGKPDRGKIYERYFLD
jgi:acyl-CoA synthetase (AMP-forming)/AMP-acid ligase II